MTQLVRIRKINPDGTAQVVHIRESACSGDCHKCSGCGAAQESVVLDARNPIGARSGELVMISSESGPVLKAAAVLYMMPLVLFFLGYLLGELTVGLGGLAGCVGFGLGIWLVVVYDRKVMGKKNTVYTITGYPEKKA